MTEKNERKIKIIILILGAFIIFFVTFLLPRGIYHFIFGYVVQNIINISGESYWLVKGIVTLLLIPFFWALCELFKIRFRISRSREKPTRSYQKLAVIMISVYIGIYFLSMHFLSRESYFAHDSGKPLKWYAETPEGIHLYDSPGYDTKYPIKLKPVTQEIIEKYKRQLKNLYPNRITVTSLEGVDFFDSTSGKPKVWYYQDNQGSFEFFDGPGFHPTYNVELKPVTRGVILSLKEKMREKQEKIASEKVKSETEKEKQKLLAYLQKYINPYPVNPAGSKEVAILAIDKMLHEEYDIEKKMVSILKEQAKNPVLSLFKKPFINDGKFEELFSGNLDIVRFFSLNKHADYIILVKKFSKFRTNPQVSDIISSGLTLQIKIIATNPIKVVNSTSISTIGPGFSNKDAEKNALEKMYNSLKKFFNESL